MKRPLLSGLVALACLATGLAPVSRADVKLPSVLGSHMVLQRDKMLPIWGWADPDEEVTVRLGENTARTKADAKGSWKVTLAPMKADGKEHTLGQSNMEMSLAGTHGAKEAIAAADHPEIRLFHVPRVQTKEPAKDVKASWGACKPGTVGRFSAALYYFGQRIHKEVGVPVGLINSSVGGSPIEPWTVTGTQSGGMHNGMIAPLQPFPIRGIIWYQGESNVSNGLKYRDKKEALIRGWRKVWGEDMPFYFVQIAPWSGYGKGLLPPLWEAQAATLEIPHTGMAGTTDLVDDIKDIHPRNKKDVGHRLALWALAKDYGKKDIEYSGPLYKGIKVDGSRVRVSFSHTAGGLKAADGKPLTDFEIAGEDGKFVPAEADIDGETVIVHAKDLKTPTQVRFGWNNTARPNLANKAGLPASPFQSKDWKGSSAE
ncbi:MAG: sialate O-acetylesterase [Planctomycetes bacterium]|nr:sialate O-acetylesterase [Planctomycetota bacterium]